MFTGLRSYFRNGPTFRNPESGIRNLTFRFRLVRVRVLFLLFLSLAPDTWRLTPALHAQTPALTTVKDTVYRSDGTPASGTVVITWPAFVTGDSKAVFGGTKTLPLTSGALAVALVETLAGMIADTATSRQYATAVLNLIPTLKHEVLLARQAAGKRPN